MMAMRNNEHTIVGDLLASAKGIDGLFTQIQSLQAHLGRARTTMRACVCCMRRMRYALMIRPAQLRPARRPRDGTGGIRAAPEGRRFKEAAAAHPAATRQGTVVGWPPRRCGKMAGQAFLCILSFIF